MTTLSLPAQSVPQPANNAAASNAFASDRSAGNQHDAPDGSTFGALLGALDDAQTQPPRIAAPSVGNGATVSSLPAQSTAEASPAASWRSVSAVHNLGSGVLVAIDKRFGSVGPQDDAPLSSDTPKAKTDNSAAMSALTNIGWAALILGATGATVAPQTLAAGSAAAAKPALAPHQLIGEEGPGAATQAAASSSPTLAAMPSDAQAATAIRAVALNAGSPPIDVKVTRAITYLGLDPTAREINAGQAAASPSPNMHGDSSAMSGEGQSSGNMHGADGRGHPAGADGGTGGAELTSGGAGETTLAARSPGVAQIDAGAIWASGVPNVQIDQLGDVIAAAAGDLNPQAGASASAATTTSASSTGPVKELEVQLNPASLGALSIEMRLSDGNLNITIKAAKSDTLKLIENERGSISDKLKSLNFSVETLTVKASDTVASNGVSGDASNSGTADYGEAQQGQSGQTADGSRNGRSPQDGANERETQRQNSVVLGEHGGDNYLGHRFV